jgi:aspartyl-tRNA(Asn)/glutamyl-tRNA(Gln) amidotransferase subunit A
MLYTSSIHRQITFRLAGQSVAGAAMSHMSNNGIGTLSDLGRQLGSGRLSSQALVEQCLVRIERENEKLHAFASVFREEALVEAGRLDDERLQGRVRGPLHGIPVAIKDLADIEGHVTGFGSRAYGADQALVTAAFVERLKQAGLVVIGTTHMVEFAFGSWGTNRARGTPWNPVDRAIHRVPGGSSSGSAVAVAAGLVPVAIGSDTGGSIRIPSALCGVVGFKPTVGTVATAGVAPLSPTFDTIGPLVNNVQDARLMFAALTGAEVPAPAKPPAQMRVGIVERDQLKPLDPLVANRFQSAVDRLAATTVRAEAVRMPLSLPEYQRLTGEIMAFEAFQTLRRIVEDPSTPIDPFVRQRALAGRNIDGARYRAALDERQVAISSFRPILDSYDVIVLPTTPLTPIPVENVDEAVFPMSRFTRIGNYLDLCGLSIPVPSREGELPVGLQALAGTGQDASLLEFGEHVERALAG